MSGHSKWHNIQKTKGAADAKRAQAFTKIAREMIVAVKEGGSGDPRSNSKLAAVIAKAKAAKVTEWTVGTPVAIVRSDGDFVLVEGKGRRGWIQKKYLTPDSAEE